VGSSIISISTNQTREKIMATSNASIIANEIKDLCVNWGWKYEVRGDILTITKKIIAGDNESFCTADMEYGSILGLLPSTSAGSCWGTDGGSGIGGMVAMNSGNFRMNKSGGSKRVLAALSKI